ncbi:GNAT family N-acetyltransferase [Salidesulfovibrio onnuriiensis]|uniref:GNAT family N-acetyltransferase n=1 Tax=Salidesulfovibrio onnuriiensis TaxID=2583823 RepID=UPI0011C88564|nr:GNAT family N-acetyltransferase [Salidesulfovibrio onnuriiensis]
MKKQEAEPAHTVGCTLRFLDEVRMEDVRSLCAITAGTGFLSEDEVNVVEELAWAAITGGESSGYMFLLAFSHDGENRSPAGFACYGPIACTEGSYHLYWIVVDRLCQGQGYGTQILRKVEERVAARQGRKLFLETSSRPLYEPTRNFYWSTGYIEEGRLKDYYAPGEDCVHFAKELQPARG